MKKFILSILSLLIVFGLTCVNTFAENIKFVQISDAHLTVDSEYSAKVLKSAIEDINKLQDVAFVIFTGDNINSPKEDNLKAFIKIINKLNVPYYLALGNHDVYKSNGLSKVRYYEILHSINILHPQRKANYKFKKGGFVFLIVDGAKEIIPGSVGYYRSSTLEWLENELKDHKKQDVVIFQHFPVEYPENTETRLKTHKTYKVEEYQKILNKHNNVLAVISGHFHVNSENMKNGVYHISTPSLLGLPNSYKIIDIITTKDFSPLIYTQLREFEVKDSI